MDQHGFGAWIRIRIDNTDSVPANSHEIGQNVGTFFTLILIPQFFINVSAPTGNFICFSPILIKKEKI
jgi:hypothetical protein